MRCSNVCLAPCLGPRTAATWGRLHIVLEDDCLAVATGSATLNAWRFADLAVKHGLTGYPPKFWDEVARILFTPGDSQATLTDKMMESILANYKEGGSVHGLAHYYNQCCVESSETTAKPMATDSEKKDS
eukprot:Skav215345  [mRNA]  locus=scaffold1391:377837:379945:- [translate_table: standard]